eukprot:m.165202 g.165202  ORF g.165202 m.165202 type:complete len:355 (-) comp18128_c0_seq1:81-1145(-)
MHTAEEDAKSFTSILARTEAVERIVVTATSELSQLQNSSWTAACDNDRNKTRPCPAIQEARLVRDKLLFQLAILNRAADHAHDEYLYEKENHTSTKDVGDLDEGIEEDNDSPDLLSPTIGLPSPSQSSRLRSLTNVQDVAKIKDSCRLRRRGAIKRKRSSQKYQNHGELSTPASLQDLACAAVCSAEPAVPLTVEERQWINFVAPEMAQQLPARTTTDDVSGPHTVVSSDGPDRDQQQHSSSPDDIEPHTRSRSTEDITSPTVALSRSPSDANLSIMSLADAPHGCAPPTSIPQSSSENISHSWRHSGGITDDEDQRPVVAEEEAMSACSTKWLASLSTLTVAACIILFFLKRR